MMTTRTFLALALSFLTLPHGGFAQGFDPSAIFGGPSVLGRALGARVARPAQVATFRPFVSARGIVDNAFTAITLDPNGEATEQSLRGYIINGGVYGSKQFKRSAVTVSGTVGYLSFRRASTFSGWNGQAVVGFSQQLGKRAVFNTTNMIGSWNRSFGLGFGVTTPVQEIDPALDADLNDDVFDTRIRFINNSNSLSYAFTPRWSASLNGGFFRTDRSRGLISVRGTNASGDIAYRLTRRQTLSASYGYTEFNYDDRYGNTFMQTIGVSYGWDLGNNWVMNLGAQGFRLEIDGLQTVQISPEIAAIIGQRVGLETFYRVNYFPGFSARVTKSFRKMSASVAARRTIFPGNGLLRTSRFDNISAFYSYTGIRKWNFGARVGYTERENLVGFNANFRNYFGGTSVGYQLFPTLQLNAGAMYRDVRSTTSDRDFSRNGWRFTFGISFSPGDIPLALF